MPARSVRRATAALLAVVGLLLTVRVQAADPDPWFGRDKALHFGASTGLAMGGYAGAALITERTGYRLLTGGTVALAAGVGKEVLDRYGHGDPSWKDFTWDVIGTATGLGTAWFVDWLMRTRSEAATPRAATTSHGR